VLTPSPSLITSALALTLALQADRALVEGSREIVLACITTDDSSVRSQARLRVRVRVKVKVMVRVRVSCSSWRAW